MPSSILLRVVLALFTAPLSLAFEAINVPKTITAGQPTTITIKNDLSRGPKSFDAMFDSYRLYLSLTPPGSGSGPACYLVNSTAINVTSLSISIPASVGPSGDLSAGYSIAAVEFNQNPSDPAGPSGFEYSAAFDFVGGTGNWSQYEIDGYVVGDFDEIPCTAYDCARQCDQKYYPGNLEGDSADETAYDCVAACPGVTYPPYSSVFGNPGDGPGGSSAGYTSTAADSMTATAGAMGTTSLAAAGGFTQNMSSATSAEMGSSSAAAATASETGTTSSVHASLTSGVSAASTTPSSSSSTTSTSNPTASKSAADLASPSQFATLATILCLLFSLSKV